MVKLYLAYWGTLYIVTGTKVEFWVEGEETWADSFVMAKDFPLSGLNHMFELVGSL